MLSEAEAADSRTGLPGSHARKGVLAALRDGDRFVFSSDVWLAKHALPTKK